MKQLIPFALGVLSMCSNLHGGEDSAGETSFSLRIFFKLCDLTFVEQLPVFLLKSLFAFLAFQLLDKSCAVIFQLLIGVLILDCCVREELCLILPSIVLMRL